MSIKRIPEDYAIVLQQVNEVGGADIDELAETLRLNRHRLSHIIQTLFSKGLLVVGDNAASGGQWLALSRKGRRLMAYLWPESQFVHGR